MNMVNKFRLVTDHQRPLLTSYTYSFWSYYILHARSAIFSQDKALIYVMSCVFDSYPHTTSKRLIQGVGG